jgi:phospholipid transport system substrate-binding protein
LVLFLYNGEKMRRLNVILLALTLFISQTLFANESEVISDVNEPAVVATEKGPVEVIQSTIVKLNQLTAAAIYSPQLASALVDQEISPLFDFDHISDEVLLVITANLGEKEKAYFSTKLKQNIITTLVSRLAQSQSGSLRFISARPIMGGSIAVQLQVNGYSRFGLNIDLLFHQSKENKWQIFDIVLNRDSLINYYQRMVSIKTRRYGVYGMLGRI